MTRDFVRTAITPFAADWGRNETVPLPTVFKIGALGLSGVRIPAEWGCSGADFTSYVLATEELAYADAGVCNMISATNSFGFKVRDFGTPAPPCPCPELDTPAQAGARPLTPPLGPRPRGAAGSRRPSLGPGGRVAGTERATGAASRRRSA